MYGEYMESKGIEKGKQVQDYEMENVSFRWQTKEFNLDCGLFMMFHMMFFVGEVFYCELFDARKRQLYRAEIAATLILSDDNKNRSEVLKNVKNLNGIKAHMLPKLLAKRKKGKKQNNRAKGGKKGVQTPTAKIKAIVEGGSASVVGSGRRGKSDGLGCTYNCGVANAKMDLVSSFMKGNKSLCANMLVKRKEVLDYCLYDDHNLRANTEVVAKFSENHSLYRGDILSLLPNVHVNSNVIECWSLVLNHIEHTEPCDTSLMFFGIRHMEGHVERSGDRNKIKEKIFEEWEAFIRSNTVPCNLEADLIFIPMVLKQHYFCVCINFKTETIEVLDNTEYEKWSETDVYRAADLIAYHMSDFLGEKDVERAHTIIDFDVVNNCFNWQKTELNNTESGNFLMMHMVRYEGQLFEADLHSKVHRRYYWLEMAAALLLADINQTRTALLDKVKEFTAGKEELLKAIKKKKKQKGEENVDERDITVEDKETNVEVPAKEKEKVPLTEIPVLRQSPRKRGPNCREGEGDSGNTLPIRNIRFKTVANPNSRGRGRGQGSN